MWQIAICDVLDTTFLDQYDLIIGVDLVFQLIAPVALRQCFAKLSAPGNVETLGTTRLCARLFGEDSGIRLEQDEYIILAQKLP